MVGPYQVELIMSAISMPAWTRCAARVQFGSREGYGQACPVAVRSAVARQIPAYDWRKNLLVDMFPFHGMRMEAYRAC
jgi:hypothetical protein